MFDMAELGLVVGVSLTTALAYFSITQRPIRRSTNPLPIPGAEPIELLFEDGFLHHATDRALARFGFFPGIHNWNDLCDALSDSFPDMPSAPGTGNQGAVQLKGYLDAAGQTLDLSWRGPLCWVNVSEDAALHAAVPASPRRDAEHRAAITDPNPVWQVDADGDVVWSNLAYNALHGGENTAATDALFDLPPDETSWRASLGANPDKRHYQITATPADGFVLCHGVEITAQIKAEQARVTFMQTLAKTFAHLPTGLAIFDRNGRLALFNPALVDLTGISATFLSRQPEILSFFDELRELRQMPEPKDYAGWRKHISDLNRRAAGSGYQDTWSLEDGRTFRVQGRPQPDGATAFLMDDITSEVMMTRSFRRELEMGQSLLDIIEDAIVVFSRSGVLTFCNAVYRNMWNQNPEAAFADVTISDCIALWQTHASGPVDWSVVEGFVKSFDEPKPQELILPLGKKQQIQLQPIAPGARMVRFRAHPAPDHLAPPKNVTAN